MDSTRRQITKIAREASRFAGKVLRGTGLGLSEFEMIHCVRHHPGIHQKELCDLLGMDKAAAARRAANLEKKGYLARRPDPKDSRGKLLFVTEKSNAVKDSKTAVEEFFYSWLMEGIDDPEREIFLSVLDRIYWKSKNERRAEFANLIALEAKQHGRTPV